MKSRLILAVMVMGWWTAAIVGRLYHLQVTRHDHYKGEAARQQERVIELDPPRGAIYDRTGRDVAISVPADSLYAAPYEIENPEKTAEILAGQLGLDEGRLAERLSRDREFVWIQRKLQPAESGRIRKLNLTGIHFLEESRRYYPLRELAAQLLGYVGTDNHGLAGLELFYDQVLAGKEGRRRVLRDSRSRRIFLREEEAWTEGQDLRTTLDVRLQYAAEKELERAVDVTGAKSGCVILLDPRRGSVLAMATYPGFDPNDFARYPTSRWRNRAIADIVEPGSLFRMITAALALENGLLSAEDLRNALSNPEAADPSRFPLPGLYGRLRDLGFGVPTGVELPGEGAGWLDSDLQAPEARASLLRGEEEAIRATPIQLATALSALVSGGVLRAPRLIEQGEAAVEPAHPGKEAAFAVRAAISPATSRMLVQALRASMPEPVRRAAVPSTYPAAGIHGRSRDQLYFFGFMPVENPVLTGLVVLYAPQPAGDDVAAAAAFGAMLKRLVRILKILPEGPMPRVWPGAMPPSGQGP